MRRGRGISGGAAAALSFLLAACGGSGSDVGSTGTSPTAAANVLPVAVTSGPNQSSANTLFTSVTICVPGSTSQCQTINNIQVDTGSNGLRILASALTLALPIQKATDGNALGECTQFVDGYSWGPVAAVDLTLSGETAVSLPVQVIGVSTFAAAPDTCTSTSDNAENTVAEFGANGILGIGVFEQDCGSGCTEASSNGGYYYSCTSTACTSIGVPLTSQVLNPVSQFATDNNGTIIVLPAVAAGGASGVTGSLIFGIDTQANNASGSQAVVQLDPQQGYFSTLFDGKTLTMSFIDSGSNGLYFNDTNISQCQKASFTDFYCPTSTVALTAELIGNNEVSTTVTFSVGDAETFSSTATALPTLAGTYPGKTDGFDLGLNFFYGRSVYNGIENHTTKAGTGPYVAF